GIAGAVPAADARAGADGPRRQRPGPAPGPVRSAGGGLSLPAGHGQISVQKASNRMWPALAPAQQLVVQCARADGPPVVRPGPIDWAEVEREAIDHGVLPQVAGKVQSVAPPDVLRRFQAQTQQIRLENLRLCAILLGLRQAFESAQIPLLTF